MQNLLENLESRWLLSLSAAPAAPSNLVAIADAQAPTIRLYWKDNSSNETGFVVKARRKRSLPWEKIAVLPANATYFKNSHLAAGTSYTYEVFALNGSGPSTAVAATAQTYTTGMPYKDGTFGTGGDVEFSDTEGGSFAISLDGNKIYVLNEDDVGGNVSELSSSGALLASWEIELPGVNQMAVQADGKLVVACNSQAQGITVERFNLDGSLDSTFNGNGIYMLPQSTTKSVLGVAVDSSGRIYVGGGDNPPNSGEQEYYGLRLNASGTLDTSYGTAGIVEGGGKSTGIADPHYLTAADTMTFDPSDDAVIVAGVQANVDGNGIGTYELYGALLQADGTVTDQDYGLVGGIGSEATGVAVDTQGRTVIVGRSGDGSSVTQRLNADGSADADWAGPGSFSTTPVGEVYFDSVTLLPDDSYIIAGTEGASGTQGFLAHLRGSDGALIGGYTAATSTSQIDADTSHVAVDPAGNIYTLGFNSAGLILSRYRV